jgi:hypothetical protein
MSTNGLDNNYSVKLGGLSLSSILMLGYSTLVFVFICRYNLKISSSVYCMIIFALIYFILDFINWSVNLILTQNETASSNDRKIQGAFKVCKFVITCMQPLLQDFIVFQVERIRLFFMSESVASY